MAHLSIVAFKNGHCEDHGATTVFSLSASSKSKPDSPSEQRSKIMLHVVDVLLTQEI